MKENLHRMMEQVLLHVEKEKPPVVVLDGMCGSGKTTLAKALVAEMQCPLIQMDDFFLPYEMRTEERLKMPGGNVHFERFGKEVLPFIGKKEGFTYRRFSCSDGTFSPAFCPASDVRIVEGSYSLHPHFQAAWQGMEALTVFLSVGEGEQLRRLSRRNPALLERFQSAWIPMENQYFAAYKIREKADLCLHSPEREE